MFKRCSDEYSKIWLLAHVHCTQIAVLASEIKTSFFSGLWSQMSVLFLVMTENTKRYENKLSFPCSTSETNQKVRRCVFFHVYLPGVYSLQQRVDHVNLCYNLKCEILNRPWFLTGSILPASTKRPPLLRENNYCSKR